MRTWLEREIVGRTPEGRKQQHRQWNRDQVDRRAGDGGKHQLGSDVEIVELVHVLVSIRVRMRRSCFADQSVAVPA